MKGKLKGLRALLIRLFVDDWRVPFTIVTVVASAALFLAVYFFVVNISTTRELCQLNASRLYDKERQVKQTREYLETKPGMERNGLNDFIRQNSLPRLQREMKFDRKNFPPRCRDLLAKKR